MVRRRPLISASVDPEVAEFVSFAVRSGLSRTRSEFVERAIRVYAWDLYAVVKLCEKFLDKLKSVENPPEDLVYRAYLEMLRDLSSERVEVALTLNPRVFTQIAEKVLSMDAKTLEELKAWANKLLKSPKATS